MTKKFGYQPVSKTEPANDRDTLTEEVQPKAHDGRLTGFTRRHRRTIVLVYSLLVLTWLLDVSRLARPVNPLSPEDKARQILSSNPLIDGHVDLAVVLRFFNHNQIDTLDFKQAFSNGTYAGQADITRLRAGGSGGAFWSVFAPCPSPADDFSDDNYAASVQFTLDQIDVMARLQSLFPEDFSPVTLSAADALPAFHSGKLISPLGVEGLHQIGNKAANLRRFHTLGARYATLTHNCHNKYADAAILEAPLRKAEPMWGGVSEEGRKLIHEMNRIGMVVDLSHVSEDTMIDVLGGSPDWSGSQAPAIFSHSSAFSICPHPRNVKDSVLELVKARDSVVMVNIAPQFISCSDTEFENGVPVFVPGNATLAQVVKHVMHIGDLIGYDHVGLGTDFDGIESTPVGLEDVSKYVDLVAELLRQGVTEQDMAKLVGGNILRVWAAVDAVAAKLQASNAPALEDYAKLEF